MYRLAAAVEKEAQPGDKHHTGDNWGNPLHDPYLFPHLTAPGHDILVTGQLLQTAGPAGVELVGTDADLRSKAELVAVVKPRAGVDHDGCRIDRSRELLGRTQ